MTGVAQSVERWILNRIPAGNAVLGTPKVEGSIPSSRQQFKVTDIPQLLIHERRGRALGKSSVTSVSPCSYNGITVDL